MKKKLFFLFLVFSWALSCTKDEQNITILNSEVQKPIEQFSKILSSAICNDSSLREFIKKEALKEFDKDYDVFYPLIKNTIMSNGKTFKDCLLCYTDNNMMQKIERSLPLLNIYVPDYSWIGAFDPVDWDTSDNDIAVGYKDGSNIKIFINGVYEGVLYEDEYPDFPILLIKNNERLRYSKETKSGEPAYSFIDEVFDGRRSDIQTKVEWSTHYDNVYNLDTPNNYVNVSDLDSRVIEAYNEFKGDDYKYQRDYIYFGLTNTKNSGKLNTYIREYIHKFRFTSANNGGLYDATEKTDENYPDGYFTSEYDVTKDSLTISELQKKDFRIEGNLEMQFHVIAGKDDGSATTFVKTLTVPFNQVFTYDKVKVKFRHKTWFSKRKWVYSIDKNCLKPLWYTADIELPISLNSTWNIGNTSTGIIIKIYEFDSGETVTKSTEFTYTTATNVSSSHSQTEGNETTKRDYGVSNSSSIKSKYDVTWTNNSDYFGDVILNYVDPIVLKQEEDNYLIRTYASNDIELMIIPKHL